MSQRSNQAPKGNTNSYTVPVHVQEATENKVTAARDQLAYQAMPPRLLTLEQAASYLGLSPYTVRTLEWRGVLSRVRLPDGRGGEIRKLLFDLRDLDRLVDRSKG